MAFGGKAFDGRCTGGHSRNIRHPQIPHQPTRLLEEQLVLNLLHPGHSSASKAELLEKLATIPSVHEGLTRPSDMANVTQAHASVCSQPSCMQTVLELVKVRLSGYAAN